MLKQVENGIQSKLRLHDRPTVHVYNRKCSTYCNMLKAVHVHVRVQ